MELEKGRISSRELEVLIIGFVFGLTLVIPPSRLAGHVAWLASLVALVEASVIAWIFGTLAARFRGLTLVQIADMVYGRYLGKVVSGLFIWFLLHESAIVLKSACTFLGSAVLVGTPMLATCVLLIVVVASAIRNGIEVIARCALVLVPLTFFNLAVSVLLLLKDIDLKNLFPLFEVPITDFLWSAHSIATVSYAHTVAFLMVIPALSGSGRIRPSTVKALAVAAIVVTAVTVRNTGVLGSVSDVSVWPSLAAVRLIDVADVFTRVEIVIAVNLMTMSFLKISIFLYGAILGTAQSLRLRSYKSIALPMAALSVILAQLILEDAAEAMRMTERILPVYATFFELGIPLLTLVVASIRKLPAKKGA